MRKSIKIYEHGVLGNNHRIFDFAESICYAEGMKRIIIAFLPVFLLGFATLFALVDTDSDGVSDDKDICPRVSARSETGCPTLASAVPLASLNACYREQKNTIIVRVQPICDATSKVCLRVSSLAGLQTCDPIFPLILQDGKPFVR